MANIFRSKEVYKKLSTKVVNDETNSTLYKPFNDGKIVAVRGMYVTGEYRPPYYNTPGIHITDIRSTIPKIVDYTQKSVDNVKPDYALNIHDIYPENDLKIESYTRASSDIKGDYALNIHDIYPQDELSILWYTSVKQDIVGDYALNIYDIYPQDELTIQHREYVVYPTAPEPCIRITNMTTVKATIEDYVINS